MYIVIFLLLEYTKRNLHPFTLRSTHTLKYNLHVVLEYTPIATHHANPLSPIRSIARLHIRTRSWAICLTPRTR